jgi:SAM-dependent methyltransferase
MAADYDARTYGDRVAEVYDRWYAEDSSGPPIAAAVAVLSELAGQGPALELGIGTGRIALPLLGAGVEVHGIDASEAMVAKLREKPRSDLIAVTIEDFRDFDLARRFRLVYVVFNTFFALLSQDDQVSCFKAVARHLTDDGAFLIDAWVPDLSRYSRGQVVSAIRVDLDEVSLDVSKLDAVAQRTDTQHVVLREDGVRLYPVRPRFAYPSELDLMARLAGMRLRDRWSGWDRRAFDGESEKHISVWELAR